MAFNEGIKVYFGGDTSGLKAALGEAGAALEHFNENTSRIQHHLLQGLFGFEAIKRVAEWAKEAIKGAQETREEFEKLGRPIDDSTRSLAEFGDAMENVKHSVVGGVGSVLSFFTRAGENIGFFINRLRGISDEQTRLNEKTARAAAEQEKKRDEAVKKHAQDGEKAAEVEKKVAEQEEKNALSQMSLDDQINKLAEKAIDLQKELAAITGEGDTARLLRANKLLEIAKTDGEIDAKNSEKKKAQQAIDKKWEEDVIRLNDKIADQKQDALKPEERIVALQAENVKLTAQLAKEGEYTVEGKQLQVKIGENQKTIDKDILTIAEKRKQQEEEIAKQKKIQLALAAGQKKLTEDFLANVYGVTGGGDLNNASNATLQDVIRKNNQQKQGLVGGSAFSYNDTFTLTRLNNEIAKAQAELDYRRKLNLDFQVGGEAGARKNFQGNPFSFERVFEQFVKSQSAVDKTLTTQQDILAQLRRGIPTIAVNAVPTGRTTT